MNGIAGDLGVKMSSLETKRFLLELLHACPNSSLGCRDLAKSLVESRPEAVEQKWFERTIDTRTIAVAVPGFHMRMKVFTTDRASWG